jgi:hypothetical protein
MTTRRITITGAMPADLSKVVTSSARLEPVIVIVRVVVLVLVC